jgi:hypothetical protein
MAAPAIPAKFTLGLKKEYTSAPCGFSLLTNMPNPVAELLKPVKPAPGSTR